MDSVTLGLSSLHSCRHGLSPFLKLTCFMYQNRPATVLLGSVTCLSCESAVEVPRLMFHFIIDTCMPSSSGIVHPFIHPFVCFSRQILIPLYLMISLSTLCETSWEYSLPPTDDLITFWQLKVKVTADRRGRNGIHVDAGVLKSI